MAKRSKPSTTPVVWKGPDSLRPLLVPIAELTEDPENVNRHCDRSIGGIAASYERSGQQKPVVGDAGKVVRAGNGQLQAAHRLGWTHLAFVVSDLEGIDLRAFALADNRTAEFSSRDDVKVAELLESIRSEPDFPIAAVGYTDAEVDAILKRIGDAITTGEVGTGGTLHDGGVCQDGDRSSDSSRCVIRIPADATTAYDPTFKEELEDLCQAWDLEFTIQPGID
jgi:hypothetical protein